ncbi:hypothetical protein [Fulvivirga kasyanovii]|uniref:hypothetical protein n=1 Tax=Fulvivirga kasyanovii TaxID=396812 RepID=UPI001C866EFB|nr:hypothetical protein [Fulvivirga kasyanovii]
MRSSPHTQVGSVIAIPVGAGDRVTASAFAKYIAASEDPGIISTTLASALINAFTGGVPGVNEGGTNTINNNFGEGSLIGGADFPYEDSDAPKAFLNLIFLPEGEAIDLIKDASFAYDQIADGATESIINGISDSPYDELRIENFEIPQNGHILVYVSNEGSLTDIYFDDLEIQINESPVVQSDDYYPFGLQFNSYQRVTAKKNDFKYNGFELQEDLGLECLRLPS